MKINRNLIGRGCLTIALDTIIMNCYKEIIIFFSWVEKIRAFMLWIIWFFFFKVCWSLKDYSGGMLVFSKFSVLYNYIFTFEVNKI
jgi:hypothetical protein